MLRRFQSTPSVWRVTGGQLVKLELWEISIHTLRVEGDNRRNRSLRRLSEISIHTLRVEGDSAAVPAVELQKYISIHTLRVEGDNFLATLIIIPI